MENIRNVLTWASALGLPTILAILVWLIKQGQKIAILMSAQQAQMRTKLLELFHKYEKRGYITEEELADWENQYQAYHALGKNGILDSRRERLLNMKTIEESEVTQ